MQTIYSESVRKILQNRVLLEKELDVRITHKGKDFFVEGDSENEYLAITILDAMNLGFTVHQALNLCEEDIILEKVNIKDLTKRHDLFRVRGRIIGTEGKTKKVIENLGECFISVKDNAIGIIGSAECIKNSIQAITSLIQGSKQSKVYSNLERARTIEKTRMNEDLGLKNHKEKP